MSNDIGFHNNKILNMHLFQICVITVNLMLLCCWWYAAISQSNWRTFFRKIVAFTCNNDKNILRNNFKGRILWEN